MNIEATLPDAYTWESQSRQYPKYGERCKIEYFAGEVIPELPPVDCLLWRDTAGLVRGILNHYPVNYPNLNAPAILRVIQPYIEYAGNVNVWVDPNWQRRGIATELVQEAQCRFGPLNPEQQTYTEAGVGLLRSLEKAE